MKKIILSRAAGEASPYIRSKKPSEYIPFKGHFPLLDESLNDEWWKWINSTDTLQDCPEWMQQVIFGGQRIARMEKAFIEYLQQVGVYEEFLKMSSSEKSTWLVRFLNANSMDIEALQIN